VSILQEEWADTFSDGTLVTKYFGGFAKALWSLRLTKVHLNSVVLKALLDDFPQLEEILMFLPLVAKRVEAFPRLQERQNITETEGSSNVVVPHKRALESLVIWRTRDPDDYFLPSRVDVSALDHDRFFTRFNGHARKPSKPPQDDGEGTVHRDACIFQGTGQTRRNRQVSFPRPNRLLGYMERHTDRWDYWLAGTGEVGDVR
jgi:hypothetical protein